MITLTSLSKVYRTNEIETVALENVNLTVARYTDYRYDRDQRYPYRRDER